jgi:hypothetical protein
MALSEEAQRRFGNLVMGASGAVLTEWLNDELEKTKTALVSAPIEHVQRLQGQAAAYTSLLSKIKQGRE